ncbi:MAG: polyprenyl synthetase family protein [Microbacteriaceae bacterium]
MQENEKLTELVQQRLNQFLISKSEVFELITPELLALTDYATTLLSSGKRFRARFAYWGWFAVFSDQIDPLLTPKQQLQAIVDTASALEIFHAAALVHDDLIDNSDTRRGQPAAHKHFEDLHRNSEWRGNAAEFGRNTALLLGDLLLGFSDDLFDQALAQLSNASTIASARQEFIRMRNEVTAGQYLDILEEQVWPFHSDEEAIGRAKRIITYKSAKYSVVAPLRIGAAIAGASAAQLNALSEYGMPLGIAFQLRDDLLGVYGDSTVTGKPSGDDLREGKRTILIALAKTSATRSVARLIDELLGDAMLTDVQIGLLQSEIKLSGAVERLERLISHQLLQANAALDEAPLAEKAIQQLRELAIAAAKREA